jgi:predicted TIM-barrel fold metal-dependent hydrolase
MTLESTTNTMPAGPRMEDSPGSALLGRILDTDTHEMYSARLWVREYGEEVEPLARYILTVQSENVPNSFAVRRETDDQPIRKEDLSSYWAKGCLAPGAFDMRRRLEVMDVMGVKESLVFGSMMSFLGQQLATEGGALIKRRFGGQLPFGDAFSFGQRIVKAHNDWCLRVVGISPRLRPVATVLTHSLSDAIAESERMIAGGVRAIVIPAGTPIEGKAPSHPDNDALWHVFAEAKVPLLLHIGGEKAFLRDPDGWTNAPQFANNNSVPTEINIDPFSLAISGLAGEAYVANLILGGVFERIPELRCGLMELGGHWIGPTAESLDLWAEQFAVRFSKVLSMKPSDYVRRNVRVSPFTFEPVDRYIERFPYLEDVFCFSTDYPHFEGGKDPVDAMARRVRRLGTRTMEKFFFINAEWLMPRDASCAVGGLAVS